MISLLQNYRIILAVKNIIGNNIQVSFYLSEVWMLNPFDQR